MQFLRSLQNTFSSHRMVTGTTTPIGSDLPLPAPANAEQAILAAGCFWGVEHLFRKQFSRADGLIDARVGYCGGDKNNPSYRAVCRGDTGHAEAVQLLYDPERLSYETILEFFFRMHDPTTANRQGADVGTQYRSAIFATSLAQLDTAVRVAQDVREQWYRDSTVVTEIQRAGRWWDAEKYHQLYLNNNPGGYECPMHFVRSFPPLKARSASTPSM